MTGQIPYLVVVYFIFCGPLIDRARAAAPPLLDYVRLVGGTQPSNGRLEVLHTGVWGTVCDDYFNNSAAIVACRMLGFHGNTAVKTRIRNNAPATGQIWLDDLKCNGNESSLVDCMTLPWGQSDCGHIEDVTVDCQPTLPGTTQPSLIVRLADGYRRGNGRLEVFHNGTWGTVCDDGFNNAAATIVCANLGFAGSQLWFVVTDSGDNHAVSGPIWIDDIKCQGTEPSLGSCRFNPWGQTDCEHIEDVWIDCRPDLDARLPVRLVNGSRRSGRVEIFYNHVWGTICDDGWNQLAAAVVCNQMHFYNTTAIAIGGAYFGAGTGNIWIDDINCTGAEFGIGSCSHRPFGVNNCDHTEDAGVMCLAHRAVDTSLELRLVGLSPHVGRLEVRHYGIWGTVCDDGFHDAAARVACGMLGYQGSQFTVSRTGTAGSGPIWLDDLNCTGTELSLDSCRTNAWGQNDCTHSEDVWLDCRSSSATSAEPTSTTSITTTRMTSTAASVGLGCFSCEDMVEMKYCDHIEYCNTYEVCYVEKYVISGGESRYRSGCINTNPCMAGTSGQVTGSTCMECCSERFCNNHGCGDAGMLPPSRRPPLCFDCSHLGHPRDCHSIIECPSGQVCSIEEYSWGDESNFIMECANDWCLDEVKRSVPTCKQCCSTDFCNDRCNNTMLHNPLIANATQTYRVATREYMEHPNLANIQCTSSFQLLWPCSGVPYQTGNHGNYAVIEDN